MDSIYLEYLINNTNQIIYTLDTDGVFTYVSNRWTELLGHDVKDVVGTHLNVFLHADDLESVSQFMFKVIAGKSYEPKIEYRIKHKDKSWRWHEANCSYIEDKKNGRFQFLGSCSDISARKEVEQNLNNQSLKFQLLLDYSTDVMFTTTDEGYFTFISKQKTNLGYRTEDLINRKYTEIIHKDFHDELFQYQIEKKSGNSNIDNLEILVKHKNGNYRWMLIRGNYVALEDQKPPTFVGIAIDIHKKILQRNKIKKDLKVFDSIFEETLGGYWKWDLKKGTLFLSDNLKQTIGYKTSDYKNIKTSPLKDVMELEDFSIFWEELRNYVKSNSAKPFKYEIRFKHKLGHHLTMLLCGIITEKKGNQVEKIIGCLVDITELSDIKTQLQNQNDELILLKEIEQKILNNTAYQIMLGQEHERNTIGQELHDGVNQLLFAAKIQLQESQFKNDRLYENGISLIEKSIDEIKYIASSQNSFLMFKKSLYDGLNELILSLPSNKIKFNLKIINKFQIKISDNKRVIILRIVQKLIRNIHKYSMATQANIYVRKTAQSVSILVLDNGVGFDIETTKKGNGHINLENKLKILHGKWFIKSKKNKGTLFYINFPTNYEHSNKNTVSRGPHDGP